jgi:predicted dienelactone hydrolase
VVVAPDHIHSTAFDRDDELVVSVGMRRPLDVAAAFDWLVEQSADIESPIAACVDPAAGYAVIGHSFGATTTLAVAGAHMDMEYLSETCAVEPTLGCQDVDQWIQDHPGETHLDRSDPRAWAAVAISPGFRDVLEDGLPLIAIPTMVIGGDGDTITPWDTRVKPMFDALTVTPRFLGQFENSGHFNVTDGCPFLNLLGTDMNGCEAGFRPPEEVLPELRTVALAFLRFVKGSEESRDWLPPSYAGFSNWEEW